MKKRTVILALSAAVTFLLAFAAPLAAESFGDRVKLSIDRPDGRYAKGEQIDVYVDAPEAMELRMQVYVNGIISKERSVSKKAVPAGRSLLYSASYDAPTSQIVRIVNPVNKKEFADIGAIVAADEFRPGFSMPDDMRKFWDGQVKALRKQKLKPVLTPVEIPSSVKHAEQVECFAFELNCPEGAPARGYLARPKGAQAKSLPILIYLHGAGVNKASNRSSVRLVANYARRGSGAIVVDLNAHGMLNDQPQSYYDDLNQNSLKDYSRREPVNHKDYYFRLMFLRAQRTLDYLCSLPEWDGERVLVLGGSQGGAQTAALAGLDPRVKVAVLNVPAMMDMGGVLDGGRRSGWPQLLENYGTDGDAVKILPYYDAANFLRMTDAKLFMEAGLVDFTCPPACVFAGYNVAKSQDKTIVCFPYKPHGRTMPAEQLTRWTKEIEAARNAFINDYLK